MIPNMFIVYGPPGAGKSTFTFCLSEASSGIVALSNDMIRSELDLPVTIRNLTPLVYKELAQRAMRALMAAKSVVLDATFYLQRYQEVVLSELKDVNCSWIFIWVNTPISICRFRVQRRETARESGVSYLPAFDSIIART